MKVSIINITPVKNIAIIAVFVIDTKQNNPEAFFIICTAHF